MNILWFTWKDRSHPLAGGAETVAHETARRLVRDGHRVVFIVGGYDGCVPDETVSGGYRVIRLGSRSSVYVRAFRYYRKHLRGWADVVIDESNALPIFAALYVREPVVLLVHHVTGKGWFRQIGFPVNIIGYVLEAVTFLVLSIRTTAVTVSESTKQELVRFGFSPKNVSIIPEGVDCEPVASLADIRKYEHPTLLFVGRICSLKRPIEVVRAFEIAKGEIPDLKLKVVGSLDDGGTNYGKKFLKAIRMSDSASSIEYLGRVSLDDRLLLMQKSHMLLVTSRKEGWGLVVSEANSQGTPAIVYDVPGLRDSTKNGITGVVCKKNSPASMAHEIVSLYRDRERYSRLRENAWHRSSELTFEKTYAAFFKILQSKVR